MKENIKAPRQLLLWGEFTGEFLAQMASNVENVSIWWRHHGDGYKMVGMDSTFICILVNYEFKFQLFFPNLSFNV